VLVACSDPITHAPSGVVRSGNESAMRRGMSLGLLTQTLPAVGLIVGVYVAFVFAPNCLGGKPSLFGSVARFCADPAPPPARHSASSPR
jgi:hypothetical protein